MVDMKGDPMTAHEVATVARQLRERVVAILSPADLACYDAYQQRLQTATDQHTTAPIESSPEEQAVLAKVEDDMQAAALHKQLLVLLRIETLPQ